MAPRFLPHPAQALMEMFGSQTALLASRLGSDLPRCHTACHTDREGCHDTYDVLSFLGPINVKCDSFVIQDYIDYIDYIMMITVIVI